jgi:hypothetical protein
LAVIFTWVLLIQTNAKRTFQEYTRQTLLSHEEIRSDFLAKKERIPLAVQGGKVLQAIKVYESERNRKINEDNARRDCDSGG